MKRLLFLLISIYTYSCNNVDVIDNDRKHLITADSFANIGQLDSAYFILLPLTHSENENIAIEANIKLANLYEKGKTYNEAIRIYTDVLIESEASIDSLNDKIGYCYYMIGDCKNALIYFNNAVLTDYHKNADVYMPICQK